MESILQNMAFMADYQRLKAVSLNPARHAAANAYEHCEMVASRVAELAMLNVCSDEEQVLLVNLARIHDIGKIGGTANPAKSVELLPTYGLRDPVLINLVKYHDTNLSWFLSAERNEPPSDKAWRKLANNVDLRLLCLFMVADRVDCPGGWQANRPLIWFLDQVSERKLLPRPLTLNDGPKPSAVERTRCETSAGVVLVRIDATGPKALLIERRPASLEIPKGHIEPGETVEQAAVRETHEETGLQSEITVSHSLQSIEYTFRRDILEISKRVEYFAATPAADNPLKFGPLPAGTRSLRWLTAKDLPTVPLISEELRPIVNSALLWATSLGQKPANPSYRTR